MTDQERDQLIAEVNKLTDRLIAELRKCADALPEDSPRRQSALDLIAEVGSPHTDQLQDYPGGFHRV